QGAKAGVLVRHVGRLPLRRRPEGAAEDRLRREVAEPEGTGARGLAAVLPRWQSPSPPVPPLPETRPRAAERHREERAQAETVAAALDRRMAGVANVRVVAFLAAGALVRLTLLHPPAGPGGH